jgi:hypothetical protein
VPPVLARVYLLGCRACWELLGVAAMGTRLPRRAAGQAVRPS